MPLDLAYPRSTLVSAGVRWPASFESDMRQHASTESMDTRANSEPIDKRTLIRNHPLFKGLDEDVLAELISHALARKLKKNAVLFRKGDAGTTLYLVSAGVVRISTPSPQGKDAVFNIITPGEILGEITIIDGGQRSADAIMAEDGQVIVIERRDFFPMLSKYPQIAIRLLNVLCGRLRRTSEQVEDILFCDVSIRLAKALLHLHRQGGPGLPTVRVTQRELSQMIGASRESTNRELRRWQRKKWLGFKRGNMTVLAPQALESLISDAG